MTMTRHDFLAKAHEIVKPRVYLEIGVQTGASLVLAEAAELAIGIDPAPQVAAWAQRPNQGVVAMRSQDYFASLPAGQLMDPPIDFAFIDGSHLFGDALLDFIHVERHLAGPRSVVFFDDVLPYSQAIAAREQPPGDWTGDVWKVAEILWTQTDSFRLTLIDVDPTGLLMVEGRGGHDLVRDHDRIVASWLAAGEVVPDEYIHRTNALGADEALDILRKGQTA